MKIKDKLKPKTPPITPGVYVGICIGVVDVGEQYSKRYDKYSNNVLFIFELPGQMIEVDGEQKPRQLSREFPYAKKQTSNIRKFLSSWNGVQYNDEQFVDLDVSSQLGRGCQLSVILNDTGEYANIDSIMPLPVGSLAPQTSTPYIKFDVDEWDNEGFKKLPEWIQTKIKKSTQYQKEHPPAGSIDFPSGQTVTNGGASPAANPAPVAASVAAQVPGGTVTPAAAQSAPTANSAPSSATVTQSPTPAATGGATPINFADYAQASLFPGTPVTAQAQPVVPTQSAAQTSGGWPFP